MKEQTEMKDAQGLTPLDFCAQRYKLEDTSRILSLNPKYKNLLFSDGKTKLVSFIRALTDLDQFKKFIVRSDKNINMCLPMDSPLWPAYTPLHLAVLFSENRRVIYPESRCDMMTKDLEIIKFCLKNGVDLSTQDTRGRTALHLAYRLNKMTVVDAIHRSNRRIPNASDEDDLSHVHIACVADQKNTLTKFQLDVAAVNAAYKGTSPINGVRPGATPLHACFACPDPLDKIRILMKAGADPQIRDARGLTPIHGLLECFPCGYGLYALQLFARVGEDRLVEEHGLSYLHVAAMTDHQPAVRRLIKSGANVDLAIKYTKRNDDDPLAFLAQYDGCTPLHMVRFYKTHNLLLQHGADVFAARADGGTALSRPHILDAFVARVCARVNLRKRMERDFGWTSLHLACYSLLDDGFEEMVEAELANVNARVNSNSPVWKGCTPLHLLMHHRKESHHAAVRAMSKILLENGAD